MLYIYVYVYVYTHTHTKAGTRLGDERTQNLRFVRIDFQTRCLCLTDKKEKRKRKKEKRKKEKTPLGSLFRRAVFSGLIIKKNKNKVEK